MTGRDGLGRGAKLKVLAKGGKRTVIHRPLQKLIALEIAESVGERECSGDWRSTMRTRQLGVVTQSKQSQRTAEDPHERLR